VLHAFLAKGLAFVALEIPQENPVLTNTTGRDEIGKLVTDSLLDLQEGEVAQLKRRLKVIRMTLLGAVIT
jgi:hypothetical protein